VSNGAVMASRAAVLGGAAEHHDALRHRRRSLSVITDSERRWCRKASGGPGQHSAAARLCGEGVWSLETMGGVDLPQDHTQRGAEPYNFSEPHRCMSGARGPTGARTTKAQVISL